jgi:transketolase
MALTDKEIQRLEKQANDIQKSVIEMLLEAGSGHTAGPLGMADVFTALYFHVLKHDPKNPAWPERDRLVLSNGHICPVLYAAMAHAGYFPISELSTLRRFGSRLQGHPHREFLPMLETSSGPLGSGLSQAVGMALADRIDRGRGSSRYIYCLMSDGELDEGQSWEAAMLAGKEKLRNLIAILDRNNIQIDGFTDDVMPLDPLRDK